MKCLLNIMFTLFFFLMLPVWAWGVDRNIYIDSRTSAGGNGSMSSPYDTLFDIDWTTVQNWVNANDHVYINLKRGSLFAASEQIQASGTSNHPITIQAYGTGGLPVIDGAQSISYGLWAKDSTDHIKIDSIRFEDQKLGGIYIDGCSHWNIVNCYFTTHGGSGEGIRLQPSTGDVGNINITDCTFNDTDNGVHISYWGGASSGQKVDGLIIEGCSFDGVRNGFQDWHDKSNYNEQVGAGRKTMNLAIKNNTFKNTENVAFLVVVSGGTNLISGNVLTNIGNGRAVTNAMQIGHSSDLIIEKNIVSGVTSSGPGDGHCIILDHNPRGFTDNDSFGVIVRHNIFEGATSINTSAGIKPFEARNCKIYGNIVRDNNYGVSINKADNTGNVFYNNTFVNNKVAHVILNAYLSFDTDSWWYNNIFYGGKTAFRRYSKVAPITAHNVYYGCTFSGGTYVDNPDVTDINSDPCFTDTANHDYTLKSGSPCIDAGKDLGDDYKAGLSPSTDWNARPLKIITVDQADHGSGWDVGAWVGTYFPSPPSDLRIFTK